jgi:predicted membrane-bound spermidine synthase
MSVAGHASPAGLAARAEPRANLLAISVIFFLSGFSALIYQITWQRALFSIFGINVEATTVVVSGFLLGLGLGSLIGGRLSRTKALPLLALFGLIELSIGLFGVVSLHVFHWVGERTLGLSTFGTAAATIGLLLAPTLLMGATLPILGHYLVQRARNVGQSIGLLYYVNTLGSAAACFVSAAWLMKALGMQGAVNVAAAINIVVATGALHQAWMRRADDESAPTHEGRGRDERAARSETAHTRLALVLILAALTGYISLSYEIVWFRAFMIITNIAPAFAIMLGAFLAGIALGSSEARRVCDAAGPGPRLLFILGLCILGSSVLGFLVLPAAAAAALTGVELAVPLTLGMLVFLQTLAAGAIFPILCHLGIAPDERAGTRTSFVYIANILGSVAGTLVTGFVLMDVLSTPQISVLLGILGALSAAAILGLAPMPRRRQLAFVASIGGIVVLSPFATGMLFADYYEKIIYRSEYPAAKFTDVVENRSGVVAINANHVVFGGGMYDGVVSVDLVDDRNLLVRPASLSLFHGKPRDVLMIGLATGAWAQIVANNPDVEHLTIIEINPGYLGLILKYPEVAGLLANPKVEVVIDDGRRWINHHPDRRFDAVIQNTTYNFRPNVTNLLSAEYLRLVRGLLKPDGVYMYNTTGSRRAQRTGCLAFPHGVRELNAMVLGNSPLRMDYDRLLKVLTEYRIDGRPLFDLTKPHHRERLAEIMAQVTLLRPAADPISTGMETCQSVVAHTQGLASITDDNMGEEWQRH